MDFPQVPTSWESPCCLSPGYDLEDLIAIDWSPVSLEIGDAVGILVTPQGVMQLSLGSSSEMECSGSVVVTNPIITCHRKITQEMGAGF